MRCVNSFEVNGIGEFTAYSLKQNYPKFASVSKDGKELRQKRNIGSSYWENSEGEKYDVSDVFYDVGGKKIQKISRTEEVKNYEVIDKTEVYDFLAESYAILDCSTTTLKNFEKKVGEDKAVFIRIFKWANRGFKFHQAVIFKFQKAILMIRGLGRITDGIKEFEKMKQAVSKKKGIKLGNVVEVKAEEIENELVETISVWDNGWREQEKGIKVLAK